MTAPSGHTGLADPLTTGYISSVSTATVETSKG